MFLLYVPPLHLFVCRWTLGLLPCLHTFQSHPTSTPSQVSLLLSLVGAQWAPSACSPPALCLGAHPWSFSTSQPPHHVTEGAQACFLFSFHKCSRVTLSKPRASTVSKLLAPSSVSEMQTRVSASIHIAWRCLTNVLRCQNRAHGLPHSPPLLLTPSPLLGFTLQPGITLATSAASSGGEVAGRLNASVLGVLPGGWILPAPLPSHSAVPGPPAGPPDCCCPRALVS